MMSRSGVTRATMRLNWSYGNMHIPMACRSVRYGVSRQAAAAIFSLGKRRKIDTYLILERRKSFKACSLVQFDGYQGPWT